MSKANERRGPGRPRSTERKLRKMVKIPDDLDEKLVALAERNYRSKTFEVRLALENHLRRSASQPSPEEPGLG